MRTYRETFIGEDGQRGLTQEELLHRMAGVSVDYAERYSHATVSRWELGRTRPTLRRVQVFGAALGLSPVDVAGLILLAGLAPDFEIALDYAKLDLDGKVPDASLPTGRAADSSVKMDNRTSSIGRLSSIARWVALIVPLRFMTLAACLAGCGYVLSLMQWDASWMPVTYVGFALALVLGQHFSLPSLNGDLSEFFWVSLFVVLTTPLLQFAPLGMDHYNIYAVGDFANTHYPYMLALLTNLALAFVGAMLFRIPWKWRYSGESAWGNAVRRAAWVVLPPVGVVYGLAVVISNTSVWIQLAVLMPVVAAVFVVLLVLRDPEIIPSERDRRFLMSTSVAVAIVTTTLGIITILAIYVSPDLPMVLPDHNLFHSWEIDFAALGLSREEALDKVNLGYMWHAMCLLAYMVFVFGAYLLVSIYRIGRGDGPNLTAESASARTR